MALLLLCYPISVSELTVSPLNAPAMNDDVYLRPIPYINAKPFCSCVKFVQELGYDVSGNAKDIKANSSVPAEGGLVLTKESKFGHIAVILKIENDSIIVIESNYFPACAISIRRIYLNDSIIRGYLQ